MQSTLIAMLVGALLKVLSPDNIKTVIDKMLDVVEDLSKNSNNKIDDAVVLPLCVVIRATLNVPDNDVEPEDKPLK